MTGIGFTAGCHSDQVPGFCAMEWVSLVVDGDKTDMPACTWHGIIPAVWQINDLIMPKGAGVSFVDRSDVEPTDPALRARFERQVVSRVPRIAASRFDDQIDDLMLGWVLADMFGSVMGGEIAGWLAARTDDRWDSVEGWPALSELAAIFERAGRRVVLKPDDDGSRIDLKLFSELDRIGCFERGDPAVVGDVCALSIRQGDLSTSPEVMLDRLDRLFDRFDEAAEIVGLVPVQDEMFDRFIDLLKVSQWADVLTVR